MSTRRSFLKGSLAMSLPLTIGGASAKDRLVIQPYEWNGPYADYRTQQNARHDWRLCADLRAPWFGPGERLILRTSEIIGHESGFLYDDHFPSSEPEGRGRNYHHIPFTWQLTKPGAELFADCTTPNLGGFSIRLTAKEDYLDVELGVRNFSRQPMRNIDWAFCAVAFECRLIADSKQSRTFLFDGQRLRALNEAAGHKPAGPIHIYKVVGANGYIPVDHLALPLAPVESQSSVVVLTALDGAHAAAMGFEQADTIYGDAIGNKCFHADPYFGPILESGQERRLHGRLYLIRGDAETAFRRYRKDFGR